MANKFNKELDRRQGKRGDLSSSKAASSEDGLLALEEEIQHAKYATQGRIECSREGDSLKVHIRGQTVAFWRLEGPDLTLYRLGSDVAETYATDPNRAAILTARLMAAVWQAK